MRQMISIAAIAILLAGGMATLDVVPVSAQTAKKKPKAKAKAPYRSPFAGWDEGGTVGCSNGPVRESAKHVLERLGGRTCEDETPAPNPAPVPAAPAATATWLVGLWVSSTASCATAQYPVRLRANGTYDRSSDSGAWVLSRNGFVVFAYRDTDSAPVRSNTLKVTRYANERMALGDVVYQRCSTNPDAQLATSAPPPPPPSEGERQVAAEADGYTLYHERPGYCTLYLDTPRGAMIRFSYSAEGVVNFSYVRPDLRILPGPTTYPALFQFDGSRDQLAIMAQDYQMDDGRVGFRLAGASPELLTRWANGKSVSIRLADTSSAPFDTIALKGSGAMIHHLKACSNPLYTVTVAPPPPPETVR